MSTSEHSQTAGGDSWNEVSFAAHEKAQLKRMAIVPFSRKLEWLEEAHLRQLQFNKQRVSKGLPVEWRGSRDSSL